MPVKGGAAELCDWPVHPTSQSQSSVIVLFSSTVLHTPISMQKFIMTIPLSLSFPFFLIIDEDPDTEGKRSDVGRGGFQKKIFVGPRFHKKNFLCN